MNVQNTLDNDKSETEQEAADYEKKVLNTVRDLNSSKITFDDIEDKKLVKEIHERFVVGEEEFSETEEVEKPVEEGKSETDTNQIESTEIIADEDVTLQKRKDLKDELNTITQKIESGKTKLGEIGELAKKTETKKFEDVTSEEAVTDSNARLKKIEDQQTEFFTSQSKEISDTTVKLQTEHLFLEMANFQFENPSLKTSKPLKTINAQYKKFRDDIGGNDNVEKFLKDKDFRAKMEADGHNFPMSEIDYKNFDQISKIHAFRSEKKYPSLTSAYHDYQLENGIVQDSVTNAALKAAADTVDKLDGQGGATTLSPEDGSGGDGKTEMSQADKQKWLLEHPIPKTAADKAKAKQIHESLFAGGGQS